MIAKKQHGNPPEKPQFAERYAKLNAEQKKAVDTIEGPLLVVAGPGSGKTELLSLRVAKILKETQARPSQILCLTFTESGAVNMRERLSSLIGEEAYRVAIFTFHGFCKYVIELFPEFFYNSALYNPAGDLDQISVLEEIFENLPATNPLKSYHSEQGYTYLDSAKRLIADLKKGGYTPEEFKLVLLRNKIVGDIFTEVLLPAVEERLSQKQIPVIGAALNKFKAACEKNAELKNVNGSTKVGLIVEQLEEVIMRSLAQAITQCEGDTKPLSAWKEKFLRKDDDKKSVLKDTKYIDKLEVLADIYKKYQDEMHKRGLYDFDDMILDTIAVIEKHQSLRYELQEQFQYMLIDEFQDTNGAQMRLCRLLADAPHVNQNPNIMAVGDDDQSIYKFQGAELSNILEFKTLYPTATLVTLTKNYRSGKSIVDSSLALIRKGSQRLENLVEEIKKDLVAAGPHKDAGEIFVKELPTSVHEFHYVAKAIREQIDAGISPKDIAIIARKHKTLEAIVPFLQKQKVPIIYEREQNVLFEPHIEQIIKMARCLDAIRLGQQENVDNLMSEILSFPFWGLDRISIWRLSQKAFKAREPWFEIMIAEGETGTAEGRKMKEIAEFIIGLSVAAGYEPLPKVIDQIVGSDDAILFDEEGEVGEADGAPSTRAKTYTSPFKEFYFNEKRFTHEKAEYMSFLASLRVFIESIKEYKQGQITTVADLVEFVDLHITNEISLADKSPFMNSRDAVSLLTAHKAKGLEYDSVFILSCQDQEWISKGRGQILPPPSNMPISPQSDASDDYLRLFYVALTRAKKHLMLTSHSHDDKGKETNLLRYIADGVLGTPERVALDEVIPDTTEALTSSYLTFNTPPFVDDEKVLLLSMLDNYQLSITHLNNFLNLSKGGPQKFFEQNILRFPQSKQPSASFGSAMHKALELAVTQYKQDGELPSEDVICATFEKALKAERLAQKDFEQYLEKGKTALALYLKDKGDTFTAKDRTEVNFRDQGVVIDGVPVTGKIDRMTDMSEGATPTKLGQACEFVVRDYKTGRAIADWSGVDDREKIKLDNFKRQLLFYKLLIENSRDFKMCKVNKGIIDFLEPKTMQKKQVSIELQYTIDDAELNRLRKLIRVIYKKIMSLDFPDVSQFDITYKGVKEFEEWLLSQG